MPAGAGSAAYPPLPPVPPKPTPAEVLTEFVRDPAAAYPDLLLAQYVETGILTVDEARAIAVIWATTHAFPPLKW